MESGPYDQIPKEGPTTHRDGDLLRGHYNSYKGILVISSDKTEWSNFKACSEKKKRRTAQSWICFYFFLLIIIIIIFRKLKKKN